MGKFQIWIVAKWGIIHIDNQPTYLYLTNTGPYSLKHYLPPFTALVSFHDPFGNVVKVGMVIGPISKVESIVVPQYIYSQPIIIHMIPHTHTLVTYVKGFAE